MRVLRRFPVSDEFISDRKTFCTILDRKQNFEISNNVFFRAEGALSIESPENIVGNRSVLKNKNSLMDY